MSTDLFSNVARQVLDEKVSSVVEPASEGGNMPLDSLLGGVLEKGGRRGGRRPEFGVAVRSCLLVGEQAAGFVVHGRRQFGRLAGRHNNDARSLGAARARTARDGWHCVCRCRSKGRRCARRLGCSRQTTVCSLRTCRRALRPSASRRAGSRPARSGSWRRPRRFCKFMETGPRLPAAISCAEFKGDINFQLYSDAKIIEWYIYGII
jgi:hypothetical protein